LDQGVANASEDDHEDVGRLRLDGQRAEHGQEQQHVAGDDSAAEAEKVPQHHGQKHENHKTGHVRDGKLEFNVRARVEFLEVVGAADERVPRQQDARAHNAE
jgi:hypothetical protein